MLKGPKSPLVTVMILVGVFVVVPILITRYESRRREIELFILKRKSEKQRDLYQAVVQNIPDHVVVVKLPEVQKKSEPQQE